MSSALSYQDTHTGSHKSEEPVSKSGSGHVNTQYEDLKTRTTHRRLTFVPVFQLGSLGIVKSSQHNRSVRNHPIARTGDRAVVH